VGGSTGVPLSFYHDRSYDETSEAGTFRNLRQCGWKPGQTIAYVWGGNDRCMQYRAGNWSCVSVCSAAISSSVLFWRRRDGCLAWKNGSE